MSHICFLLDTNSICKVFNITTLMETDISFQEFQTQFNPSNALHANSGINRCIIKTNLEEYNNEKDKLILIDSYNKFIEKKARLELGPIDKFKPSNTLVHCIERCKLKYPISEFTIEKCVNNS